MIRSILYFFLLASIAMSTSSCNVDIDAQYCGLQKVMVGDSLEWSQLDYDNSNWDWYDDRITADSIFWVRWDFDLNQLKSYKSLVARIGAMGSYDIYWDGIIIGSNGSNGLREEYRDGIYINYVPIPDSLTQPGNHTVALRTLIPYDDLGQHAWLMVGDHFDLTTMPFRVSLYMFLIGGIFLIASIYFMFLFFTDRKDVSLSIFALICISFLILLLLEYIKLFHPYPYPFQRTRLVYISYLHIALTILVPLFFALQLNFPFKKWLIGVLLLGTVCIEFILDCGFDGNAILQNKLLWACSLIVVLYGCWQKKKEAIIVLIGFAASMFVFLLTDKFDFPFVSSFDVSLFLSFLCIIFSMLYILTYRRRQERLAYEQSLVTSERLKTQLLRKNIKPHFIMNTLTTLIDWVEESPEEGVGLIHALANEFEVLNDIADHKLVPINQEIKLCRHHLTVMGYRKEINYQWLQSGVDENEIIPPAVLHTIVENGVTHSKPEDNKQVIFTLTFKKEKNYKQYDLLVSGMESESSLLPVADEHEGTGTKYIKSRLAESYGEKWTYESGPTRSGWLSSIRVFSL